MKTKEISLNTFHHTPLRDRQIRLIQTWKDSKAFLRFSFCIVDLDDNATPYTALSYTWGNQARRASAYSEDGRVILLTENCFDLLITFTSSDRSRYIWVDALCINQDDLDEKARQIPLMGQIYAKAQKVTVWLGKDTGFAEHAFAFVETLRRLYEEHKSEDDELDTRRFNASSEHGTRSMGWQCLEKLLWSRWWGRVWVVQEVALSTADPEILCGSQRFPWITFCQVLYMITNYHHFPGGILDRLWKAEMTYTISASVRKGKPLGSLSAVLQLTSSLDASDPRDRIYAALGMVRPQDLVNSPAISYTIDRQEVFFRWTVHLLVNLRQPHCFGQSGMGWGKREAGLRSWVADFSKATSGMHYAGPREMSRFCETHPLYDPSPGLDGYFHVGKSKTLQVKGRIVDTLKYRMDLPKDTWSRNEEVVMLHTVQRLVGFQNWLEEWVQSSNAYRHLSKEGRSHVIWQTVSEGSHCSCASPEAPEAYTSFMKSIQTQSHTFATLNEAILCAKDWWAWNTGHELFGTYQGFLGTGPPEALHGDKVCIVHGLYKPLILRELPKFDSLRVKYRLSLTKPYYQLVGECYVHGMMQGEGLGMADEQLIELT